MRGCAASLALFILMTPFLATPSLAADHTVQMPTKSTDGEMVFEPILTKLAMGDTIFFVSTDKGHQVSTIETMMPPGAPLLQSADDQTLTVTFDTERAYVLKCAPHFGMGTVAVVIVGQTPPANLDAIKTGKLPKKARERVDTALVAASL